MVRGGEPEGVDVLLPVVLGDNTDPGVIDADPVAVSPVGEGLDTGVVPSVVGGGPEGVVGAGVPESPTGLGSSLRILNVGLAFPESPIRTMI